MSSRRERSPEPRQRERSRSRERPVEVYVDGACSANGKKDARAGWGAYYGEGDPRNACGPVEGKQSNNTGELRAIVDVLRTLLDDPRKLIIYSDSKYAIQCLGWAPGWRRKDWRTASGAPVQNVELVREMVRLHSARAGPTELVHVRGHAGIAGNEAADRLARRGAAGGRAPHSDGT